MTEEVVAAVVAAVVAVSVVVDVVGVPVGRPTDGPINLNAHKQIIKLFVPLYCTCTSSYHQTD